MSPPRDDYVLGRRIVIWGETGTGKTTLTRELASLLDLTFIDLDAIRHETGWDSTPWDEMAARITAMIDASPRGWVSAGSYSAIFDSYLPHADTLIWLHLPWRVSFWRLLLRTVGRAVTQEPLYNPKGPHESWRISFLSPRSILWWSISHHSTGVRTTGRRIAALPPEVRIHELRSSREVEALVVTARRAGRVSRA